MKKGIAYIAYISAVTLVFLYYLFPSNALKAYMNHHVSRLWPQFHLTAANVVPTVPPGLKLNFPVLYRNEQTLFGADHVKFIPGWLSVFSPEKTVRIRGAAYDGAINGTIAISGLDASPVIDLDLVFGGIKVGRMPVIASLITHEIDGIAAGRLFFANTESPSGKGRLELMITDGSVALNPPLLGIEQLSFNSIEGEAELADRRIRISRFNVKGREVDVNATGTIILRDPIDTSVVNMSGQLLPHPSFIRHLAGILPAALISEKTISGGGIPFRVSGTIAQPSFALK